MNFDRDLFVQAFWVKCRELIRPELERALDRLRGEGIEAEISTQEGDDKAAASPGPSLTLAAPDSTLSFYGDVARQTVRVVPLGESGPVPAGGSPSYSLDALGEAEVAGIVAAWEAERRLH